MSPNVNDLKSSKFLTKYDVEPAVLVTIESYEEMNVALESQTPEMKWTLSFREMDKPLVLNSTNGQLIQAITGSGEFGDWIGKKVVLYNDKTVSYAGKITGGIRVRAPRNIPQRQTAEEIAADKAGDAVMNPNPTYDPDAEGDESIPF